jgi:hypothetical protein
MTAEATGPSFYVRDLRKSYDQRVDIQYGVLYRKGNVLQVWWTHNSLGEPFINPYQGRETWTMPTENDAVESFVNRWATDGF